jgi:uncharacterized membrane protein YedE/YeeE
MGRDLAALFAGLLFGLGLAVSQMINPQKVQAFLDVTGDWDPSLALVMGGALAVTGIAFRFVLRRPGPVFGERFALPIGASIDLKLIAGAAIFGAGWGLAGYCPGPALASLSRPGVETVAFITAMLAGSMLCAVIFERKK